MLGINTDASLRRVRQVVGEQQLTWPSWIDGSTHGPIDTMFAINHRPTVYVLDAKGVIRFIDPDDFDHAIDTLLKDMGSN